LKKGEELSKLKGVISASIVTGRYDIIITVLLKEQFGLLEFLTGELSKVKDIQSTETFVVYKSFNLKVPYPY
jgi:Lrp/AsnC family transcriptional regulator, regulator for asnA, asnC and gidA